MIPKVKTLKLVFENIPPRSKQHSHGRREGQTFVNKSYQDWKNRIAWEAKLQARTQGWKYNDTDALNVSWVISWPYRLGDADNLCTAGHDAFEGVLFLNDGQIVDLSVKLIIAFKKTIEITIETCGLNDWATQAIKRPK